MSKIPKIVKLGYENNSDMELIEYLANIIQIRAYIVSMYTNSMIDKETYKRMQEKVKQLDKHILNLTFLIQPAYEARMEEGDPYDD